MEINKINVGQIVSMKSYINNECRNYRYFEERKFLWRKKPAGFYGNSWGSDEKLITKEKIESENSHLVCRNKMVYYKPHLEFRMSNGSWYTTYFESEEELKKCVETSHLAHVYWIDKK